MNLLYVANRRTNPGLFQAPGAELLQADGAPAATAYDALNRRAEYQRGSLGHTAGATRENLILGESVDQTWGVDPSGNYRRVVRDADGQWAPTATKRPIEEGRFTFKDGQGRRVDRKLAPSDGPSSALGIKYDAWGNVAEEVVWSLTYKALGETDRFQEAHETLHHHFAYDATGRRIGEDGTHLFYDAAGHLVQESAAADAAGAHPTAQYVYGADGQLLLRDRDADASAATGSLGQAGSGLDERLYALHDARGNVTAIVGKTPLTGGAWGVLERYRYTPEGFLDVRSGEAASPAGVLAGTAVAGGPSYAWRDLFGGGRRDADGLYYVGGKEYDALTGGPLATDPVALYDARVAYSVWATRNAPYGATLGQTYG